MFYTLQDAKTWLVNSGLECYPSFDELDNVAEHLYRNAKDLADAEEIVKNWKSEA